MQYPYDPGSLPSCANQCVHGNLHLRSNLSRKYYTKLPRKRFPAHDELGTCTGQVLSLQSSLSCTPEAVNLSWVYSGTNEFEVTDGIIDEETNGHRQLLILDQ